MYHSQNNEAEVVINYFNQQAHECAISRTVLSIGENDGKTFSNSFDLINKCGWHGYLIEPSPKAFKKLFDFYDSKGIVSLYNVGIGNITEKVILHESGSYENKGEDIALYSTANPSEKNRWGNKVSFEEVEVQFMKFSDFINQNNLEGMTFDFITIDAEGYDLQILMQIDLEVFGCKCLCIEHNGNEIVRNQIIAFCNVFGLNNILTSNAENIIIAK